MSLFIEILALVFPQDGHFENTYYSDFISNLVKIKYAGGQQHKEVKGRMLSLFH